MMKAFITTFFVSVFIFLSLSVGLIWSIDPYNKMGNNLFGFETKAVAQSRENKFYMLESSKKDYEVFILGSSAAHRYPTQVANALTGMLTFNYAVQHSTPIDYLAQTKHIIDRFSPKLILLQVDFAGLDSKYRVDNRLFNSPLKKYLKEENDPKQLFDNNSFTLDALRDSFRVIFVNLFGEARHIYLEDGNYRKEKPASKKIRIRQGNNTDYTFAYDRLEILKEIRDLCKSNNINFIIFTAPLSYGHIKKINSQEHLKAQHELFVSELKSNFDHFYNFQNENIKTYNSSEYFRDSTHPSKKMSTIILEKILK